MASYTRPSLATLIARVIGDISSKTQGSAYIKIAVERFLAKAVAGVAHGLHGHLDWVRRQFLPTTADLEGLLGWGAMLEVERKVAQKSSGPAAFTGTNATVLPTLRQVQGPGGVLYTVTVGGTVSAGSVAVTLTANDAGAAGDLEPGAVVSLVQPLAGIDTDGVVIGDGLRGGFDIEDPEDYRPRVVEELRNPQAGGGPGDYVKWAKEVAGVTRAWEFPHRMGIGTISLAFVMDARADIIPLPADVAEVQAYIDSKRPLDMRAAYVQAPVAKPVNLTVALTPNTVDVQAAVLDELGDVLRLEPELEGAIAQSVVDEAISTAQGETSHGITAITSLSAGTWEILTLGTVTFTG
jgi:uncharacterized phage protein gp47/JayE